RNIGTDSGADHVQTDSERGPRPAHPRRRRSRGGGRRREGCRPNDSLPDDLEHHPPDLGGEPGDRPQPRLTAAPWRYARPAHTRRRTELGSRSCPGLTTRTARATCAFSTTPASTPSPAARTRIPTTPTTCS